MELVAKQMCDAYLCRRSNAVVGVEAIRVVCSYVSSSSPARIYFYFIKFSRDRSLYHKSKVSQGIW